MPLQRIALRPGVTTELTQTLNQGGWSKSQLVRFFAGQIQKYGGWTRISGIPPLAGQCRGLFAWADLVGTAHLAAGTDQRLSVLTAGVLNDLTPIVSTTNAAPAFATIAGSVGVVITDANHQPAIGDNINIVAPVSQGGVIIQGFYQVVTSNLTSDQYAINLAQPATLTQPAGGAVPRYTTTNGSPTVTVVLGSHGFVVGSNYNAVISTTVATLIITGNYNVNAVIDANTFQINATGVANATTTASENSGNAQIAYLLPSGYPVNTPLSGYGVGDYGAGDWGLDTVAGVSVSLVGNARTWSLDHFGQDLIASPDLGAIYFWQPPNVAPAAVLSVTAPTINRVVFAVAQVQIIFACGSSVGGVYSPTLIRWCDSGDFTDWDASATNQAGSYLISSGSSIRAAMAVGLGALIWTDTDLWTATYQGLPFVFGFNQIGTRCEAISKKAPATVGTLVIWPSQRGFFKYEGNGVVPVECPVWDFFFDNLDVTQTEQICSAVNTLFNEVTWYFPVDPAAVSPFPDDPLIDATAPVQRVWYVRWNFLENVWDYGQQTRTAWIDHSPYGNPVGTDENGIIYIHETGTDADGAAMLVTGDSGYYEIGQGDAMQYVNTIIPDFNVLAGAPLIQITVFATDYPDAAARTYGPFTVTPTTRRINCSIRGRQIAFRISSSDVGSSWRMGAVRYQVKPAGTRP